MSTVRAKIEAATNGALRLRDAPLEIFEYDASSSTARQFNLRTIIASSMASGSVPALAVLKIEIAFETLIDASQPVLWLGEDDNSTTSFAPPSATDGSSQFIHIGGYFPVYPAGTTNPGTDTTIIINRTAATLRTVANIRVYGKRIPPTWDSDTWSGLKWFGPDDRTGINAVTFADSDAGEGNHVMTTASDAVSGLDIGNDPDTYVAVETYISGSDRTTIVDSI